VGALMGVVVCDVIYESYACNVLKFFIDVSKGMMQQFKLTASMLATVISVW